MNQHPRITLLGLIALATLVAIAGARPQAGSWSDGATLATVESLVDQRTLAIDNSIFVEPEKRAPQARSPYAESNSLLNERGTLDKVFIDGHYYAAKPLVPAVLMAGEYALVQRLTGLTAAQSPTAFVYAMTLLTSGLAYVITVACIYLLALEILRSPATAALIAASVGLGSVALVYSRQVNLHLVQFACVSALFVALIALAKALREGRSGRWPAVAVGLLLGLAYVCDQGSGPAIALGAMLVVLWRTVWQQRAVGTLLLVVAAASPAIIAQHGMNFAVGHTLAAINSHPEHLAWPGSPWNATNMSGVYSHASLWKFTTYSVQLLVGKKGFLLHNPWLLAACFAAGWLLVFRRNQLHEYPEVVGGAMMCLAMWGVYSWGSTNYSGDCISVRWFLPMLAPAALALAVYLRERPQAWGEVGIFLAGSIALNAIAWNYGPWHGRVLPGYWLIVAATLATWGVSRTKLANAAQRVVSAAMLPGARSTSCGVRR